MGSDVIVAVIAASTILSVAWPALYLAKRALDQRGEAMGLVQTQLAARAGGKETVSTQRPLGEETQIQRAEAEEKLAAHLQREYANQGRQILPGEAKAQAQLMLDSVVW